MKLLKPFLALFFAVTVRHAGGICPKKPVVDLNNKATFNEIKSRVHPSELSTSYDAQGLQPFFNLANSFMNTVQPKSFGEHFKGVNIADLTNSENLDKLKDYEIPILVAAGFGLLFFLVMPIVGICFCCCRLCGKCGGQMHQELKSTKQHMLCKIMVFVLFIITIFMLCGVLFMFVTNNRFHSTAQDVGETYTDAVNEAINFANSTVKELASIPNEQVPCILSLVKDDISDTNFKVHFGKPVQDAVNKNISGVLSSALNISTRVAKIDSQLKDVNSTSEVLLSLTYQLKAKLREVRNDLLQTAVKCNNANLPSFSCDEITSYTIDSNLDFGSLPDLSSQQQNINDVSSLDLESNIKKAQTVLEDIPETTNNKSKSARNSIHDALDDAEKSISDTINDLTMDFDKQIIDKQDDLLKYNEDYLDPTADHFKYENYRWYGFIGLSSIMALIVLLLGVGLTLGVCGYSTDKNPSNRTSTATCGGNCLMAAVGFMFIFSALLMLFCVVSYALGIHFYIVCRDMKDAELIDDLSVDIKYNGKRILISDMLKNCRKSVALYTALNGEKYYNITEKLDIEKQTADIRRRLEDLKINLNDQDILTSDAEEALNKLITSNVNLINFTSFFNTLNSTITEEDLVPISANLTKLEQVFSNSGQTVIATDINNARIKLDTTQNSIIPKIQTNMTLLRSQVEALQSNVSGIEAYGQKLLDDLQASESYVQSGITGLITTIVLDFLNREISWLTQGTDHLIYQVQKNVAKCKPVANLYDGLVNAFMCDNVVQNSNGFWLALGWCLLFFVPAIIFSVKLAKYFRKMDYDSGYDGESQTPYNPHHDKIPLKDYNNQPPPPYLQNEGYMHM